MKKRHTILLDEDLEKRLRKLQADLIVKENHSVSLSSIISQLLEKSLN
ncbi:MAG: hypothetical protein HZA82_07245 [Thaumarchaeota archaeon]|nr:hypothetical protein [Nitrososphaerota archaeon]